MICFKANNITYTLRFPAYPENLFVDHFLVMKGSSSQLEERLFPNNKAELFINLGEKITGLLNHSNSLFSLKESVISGVRDTYFTFTPVNDFFMAGIRFTLFGFYYLFKIPAYHFTDQNFIATDIWGNEMEWLREQLLESPDNGAIFSTLHNWILSKMVKADLQQLRQWKKIESQITQPNTPVGELLDKVMGYSHKHSIHLFKEKGGLKPKMIQKVSRFETVSQMLSQKGLSGLDYLSYADQSHLIREFKAFTGYTPVEYLRSKPIILYQYQQLQDTPYPQE